MQPKLIGLAGPAGVGKDTVAGILFRYGWVPLSFAAPMKEALRVLGLPEPSSRAEKEALVPGYDFTWRQAAQRLGTEWIHPLDRNFWVKNLEARMRGLDKVVISDVRFQHEVDWLYNRGGILVHIQGRATSVTGAASTHASEQGLPRNKRDRLLDNGGSIADLEYNVSTLLRRMDYEVSN